MCGKGIYYDIKGGISMFYIAEQFEIGKYIGQLVDEQFESQNTFCYEIDEYCINILKKIFTAEDFFVDIYCLDSGDDIFDEKNLRIPNSE